MTPPTDTAAIYGLVSRFPAADAAGLKACDDREPQLTKPAGSLGRLTPETAAGVAVQALRAFRIQSEAITASPPKASRPSRPRSPSRW